MESSSEPKLILAGFSSEDAIIINWSSNLWEEPSAQEAMDILTWELIYVSRNWVNQVFNPDLWDVVVYKRDINNVLTWVSIALEEAFPSRINKKRA